MSGSTPGPWEWFDAWRDSDGRICAARLRGANRQVVAEPNDNTDIRMNNADALLISAAPEMLQALRRLRDAWHNDYCTTRNHCGECIEATAVIEKAEGRS